MVVLLYLVSTIVAGVLCIPPLTDMEESLMKVLSKEEFTRVTSLSNPVPYFTKRTSFKHKYVYCNGGVADYKSGTAIDIMATAAVSGTAHAKAATIISRMVMHMPSSICNALATRVKVGVFTKSEGMTIYPVNSGVQDRPECRGTCAGGCSNTCTFDGRKYTTLAGSGGSTATILDDNLLCDRVDPYHHQNNILVHEFTHSIHGYALDSGMKTRITNAYNAARSHRTWELSSYAMQNDQEYLAEGAAAYFHTKVSVRNGNYMNDGQNISHVNPKYPNQIYVNLGKVCPSLVNSSRCSPGRACTSENAARNHIYQKDRELYNILTWIFTSNRPDQPGYLSACV